MPRNKTIKIDVKGVVQGVGFRPFVYHLADQYNLKGWVLNSTAGVEIEITGLPESIQSFIDQLKNDPPPLARIDDLRYKNIALKEFKTFEIRKSKSSPDDFMPISADICVCDACLSEMKNPSDRRYLYPFINCTNCGPRFTIIQDIPYDRPYTTMSEFKMCDNCQHEYDDPKNRRFHAQPIACPVCGPETWLTVNETTIAKNQESIQLTRSYLKNGKILAIKGLGGYHLACDAFNKAAVTNLRNRKKRSDKPFALMAYSIDQVKKYCVISSEEENLLESIERPIVLLEKIKNTELSEDIAPGQNTLGIMLPYTPLHYLLLEPGENFPDLLVMTSGNISDEPIAFQDADAANRLATIADAFLVHNRPIHMRIDDSVSRIVDSRSYILRRSRGYAPSSFLFHYPGDSILATGAELKNTFCLTRENQAFLSHHIGDMENLETLSSFEEAISHYEKLFRINPKIIACDLHPNYLATRYAVTRSENENLSLINIQHHHAHLAACIAENSYNTKDPVIGLCFDGTGYGTDQAIWGGEVLIGNMSNYQRRFHLKYVPLPGGDISIKIPARMALSHLWTNKIDWEPIFPPCAELCMEEKAALEIQLIRNINTIPTSSMGRLFDAVASFIGVRHRVNYEGQAAIEMESMVDPFVKDYYQFDFIDGQIDPAPLWNQLISDSLANKSQSEMASKFHNAISQLCLEVCEIVKKESNSNVVALSGGVWQNKVLLCNTIALLQKNKFDVLWHAKIPTNDGGIAYGQACIAANLQ